MLPCLIQLVGRRTQLLRFVLGAHEAVVERIEVFDVALEAPLFDEQADLELPRPVGEVVFAVLDIANQASTKIQILGSRVFGALQDRFGEKITDAVAFRRLDKSGVSAEPIACFAIEIARRCPFRSNQFRVVLDGDEVKIAHEPGRLGGGGVLVSRLADFVILRPCLFRFASVGVAVRRPGGVPSS